MVGLVPTIRVFLPRLRPANPVLKTWMVATFQRPMKRSQKGRLMKALRKITR